MSDVPDLSSLFEMLNTKNVDVNSLIQNISSNNIKNNSSPSNNSSSLDDILNNVSKSDNNNHSDTSQNNDFQMPDMETMMKIMKLVKSMNSNTENPSANLLYSLKPFLRESKKEKIDQYIKFLKISSVLSEINKSGGDSK